jgi:hypothetical protein
VELTEISDALGCLPTKQLSDFIRDLIFMSELSKDEIRDLCDSLVGDEEPEERFDWEDWDNQDDLDDLENEEAEEESDEEEESCGCCRDSESCPGCDVAGEPKISLSITSSDDDEDPINVDITTDQLKVIIDKSNQDGVSFEVAFANIIEEYMDELEENEDEDEDSRYTDPFGF